MLDASTYFLHLVLQARLPGELHPLRPEQRSIAFYKMNPPTSTPSYTPSYTPTPSYIPTPTQFSHFFSRSVRRTVIHQKDIYLPLSHSHSLLQRKSLEATQRCLFSVVTGHLSH